MLMILALAAVVIDGGHAFFEKKRAQNAVDAASLAAAGQLPTGAACSGPDTQGPPNATCLYKVRTTAEQYLGYNGYPMTLHACADSTDTNCYLYPYGNNLVQVRVSRTFSTFFGGVIGIPTLNVSASAAAGATAQTTVTTTPSSTSVSTGSTVVSSVTSTTTGGTGGEAFAMSSACPAITYTGDPKGAIIGALQTNGGVTILGSAPKEIQYLSMGLPSCLNNQQKAKIDNLSTFTPPMNWPLPIPPVPTPPDCKSLGSSSVTFTKTGNPPNPPGIYCLGGTNTVLSLAGNTIDFTGYTFFAPCISISGNNNTFSSSPLESSTPTVFFATDTDSNCGGTAFIINGQGNHVNGDIFVPSGQITLQGGAISSGNAFLESQTLSISGNSAEYNGTGPTVGGTQQTSTSYSTSTYSTTITIPGTTTTITTGTDAELGN
jgi:hypothetical protein